MGTVGGAQAGEMPTSLHTDPLSRDVELYVLWSHQSCCSGSSCDISQDEFCGFGVLWSHVDDVGTQGAGPTPVLWFQVTLELMLYPPTPDIPPLS